MGQAPRDHARGRLDRRAARRAREALEHVDRAWARRRRARPGARRGDGDLGRARRGAAAADPGEAAVAQEPPGGRLPLADTGLTLADWRAGAPELAEEVAEEWGLRLGEAYVPGVCGHVVRAELPDGAPAVLKVYWPHRESLQEADALERWNGEGAVRLLAHDA